MIGELEIILLVSSTCWSLQHVVSVFPRTCIIKLTNEVFYTYLRVVVNTAWYSVNIMLYCIVFLQFDESNQMQDKVVYNGVGILAFIVRMTGVYLLLLCLMVAPSQFDIAAQRNQNRRNLKQPFDVDDGDEVEEREKKEIQTCCSARSIYSSANESDQIAVYGLSHITRHPLFLGFELYFVSFLLHNVLMIDVFFYVPQMIQVILGGIHQEYRMKQQKGYNYYFEHTSIIPFVAMIKGKTTIHWNETKRIVLSLFIITLLLVVILGIASAWFGKEMVIDEINNHIQGGFTIMLYIGYLIIVDVVALCSGRYYRAT